MRCNVNVLLLYLILRRRAQNTPPENPKLEFNGPYGITDHGSDSLPTTNNSTVHNNQAFAPDSNVDQSKAIYHDVQNDNEYAYAYADSGPQHTDGSADDGTYAYAETPSDVRSTAPSQSPSPQKGWKDNSIYARSNEDDQSHAICANNTEEGWEDNSVYATSGGDDNNQSAANNAEGWAENEIYGD